MRELYDDYINESYDPGPNRKYTAAEAPQGYSYKRGQLPLGTSSSGSGRGFDAGQGGQGIAVINSDEEVTSSTERIIRKIEELIDQSKIDGADYTVYQLTSLLQYITGR
jgi:hypothetical protein